MTARQKKMCGIMERNKKKEWKIAVHVWGPSFKVKFESHRTCEAEYERKIGEFQNHSRSQTADPPPGVAS